MRLPLIFLAFLMGLTGCPLKKKSSSKKPSPVDHQQVCELDQTKAWQNGQCLDKTDEQICTEKDDHEWKDGQCVTIVPPKTPEEECAEKDDHEWKDGQCVAIVPLKTPEEECAEKDDHEWRDGQCIAKDQGPDEEECLANNDMKWENNTCLPKTEQEKCQSIQGSLWIESKCVTVVSCIYKSKNKVIDFAACIEKTEFSSKPSVDLKDLCDNDMARNPLISAEFSTETCPNSIDEKSQKQGCKNTKPNYTEIFWMYDESSIFTCSEELIDGSAK